MSRVNDNPLARTRSPSVAPIDLGLPKSADEPAGLGLGLVAASLLALLVFVKMEKL